MTILPSDLSTHPSGPSMLRRTQLWIRPHIPLADNIVSHSISPSYFLRLMNHYGVQSSSGKVITRYYNYDQIMEVDQDRRIKCIVTYPKEIIEDIQGRLELVGIVQYNLSVMSFPLNNTYHHERQSIVFTKEIDAGVELQLEMLVENIVDPEVRKDQIPELLRSLEATGIGTDFDSDADADADLPVISLSYLLVMQPKKYTRSLKEIGIISGYAH